MTIEINSPSSPSFSPNVYGDGKKMAAPKKSICDPYGWSDDELILLLGEVNFTDFQEGFKYKFNIQTSHVKLVTGQRPCKNNHELRLLSDFGIL